MPPVHPIEFVAISAQNMVDEVLRPGAIAAREMMAASCWRTPERVSLAQAQKSAFQPVSSGWRWGPVWSTAWFKLRGTMPLGEGTPALRFSSGTEALLYVPDGRSWHGLDMYRDLARLPASCEGDIELFVEAACNRPLGATLFWWDPPEDHARWSEDTPGRFEHAELVRVHEPTWKLAVAVDFARRLLLALPRGSAEAQRVSDVLVAALGSIDDVDPRATSSSALLQLEQGLNAAPRPTQVIAVGHAHIDTAWLWPIAETRRKIRRSWSTVLQLMNRYDDFVFTASQAQQYAWLEADDPALFARIADRVREGRWEASGAMWVEPDCQVPSGESLVRQLVLGTAYWRDRFGEAATQSVLYLPDTFGFPASLPQLIEQAGLKRFITNKICWNEVTTFPHVDFTWRGIDGTAVPAHFTPGHTYNAALEPADLIGAEANAMADGPRRSTTWLQPFGYGDGGGGPTDDMAERMRLSASCIGLPSVRAGRLDAFERTAEAAPAAWDGELYLEMHRGTFTSQGWLKRANLQAEESLRLAEMLSWSNPSMRIAARRTLEPAWQQLLLQQFHDILPGSSIGVVYDDARTDMAQVQGAADASIDAYRTTDGVVFNPASTPRAGIVQTTAGPRWHDEAPPLGTASMAESLPNEITPVTVDGCTLDNGLLRCRIGEDGAVHDLHAAGATGPMVGALGQLSLHRDRPRRWEAWDIDREYEDAAIDLPEPISVQVIESTPMQAVIEVRRSIGAASTAVQRFLMRAGSPVLDVVLTIDWAESKRLLRCTFDTGIHAVDAQFGIQFGHIRRSSHRNMPFDEARFEVPGHRWMNIAEVGRGLAVLDQGIYGKSAHGGCLGLSLLRSTTFPDPAADRGAHVLRWGLMPHGGNALQAGVVAEAEVFSGRGVILGIAEQQPPFALAVSTPAAVEIAACKGAQDDCGRIIRLVEMHGAHGTATLQWPNSVRVTSTDLHEQRIDNAAVSHDGDRTSIALRPFGVTTLRIEDDA